jgi:hypothetical protein
MSTIWQPNEIWQAFIEQALASAPQVQGELAATMR